MSTIQPCSPDLFLKSSWSQKCIFNPFGPYPRSYCSQIWKCITKKLQRNNYFIFLCESLPLPSFRQKKKSPRTLMTSLTRAIFGWITERFHHLSIILMSCIGKSRVKGAQKAPRYVEEERDNSQKQSAIKNDTESWISIRRSLLWSLTLLLSLNGTKNAPNFT